MKRGRFISFEGGEGAGKSTQIVLLADMLSRNGIKTVCVREPGGTLLGERVRYLLKEFTEDVPVDKAETMLFLAARAQLVENVIKPALDEGTWVLSDRFCDSTVAYQGFGRGLPIETLSAMNDFVCSSVKPDLTFFLDLTVEESAQRMRLRETETDSSADRIEQAGDEFHSRIRTGFFELAKKNPDRFVTVDASKRVDEVWSEICSFVKPLIS